MSEPVDICLWIDAVYLIPQLTKLKAAFIRMSASSNNKNGRVGEFQLLSSVFSCRIMLDWSIIWLDTAREYNKAPVLRVKYGCLGIASQVGIGKIYTALIMQEPNQDMSEYR